MTFEQARQAKFERGKAEHGEPFDAEHIDWRREAQGELIDLWHYIGLADDEVLKVRVQSFCQQVWQELQDMGE